MGEEQAAQSAEFARAHARLLADESIQFDLATTPPPPTPPWMLALGRFLREYFWLLEILFWGVVGALVLALVAFLAMRLTGTEWPWKRKPAAAEPEDWRPAEAPARALLRDADSLAAEGRFSEAAHLLLFRSIEEIDARRPRLVRPALTSRDIAADAEIPGGPRTAFAAIVMIVERSLFGGRALAQEDWRRCRSAYEEFAFAGAWR